MTHHLVAGGGGFVGSHLADVLLARGDEVTVVDNFATGRRVQRRPPRTSTRGSRWSSTTSRTPLPPSITDGSFDTVLDLASPASPVDFATMPLEILAVGSTGTRNLLDLAVAHGARFFLASTSEVYGDPLVHPQPETLLGQRQLDRPAELLRRGQAVQRGDHDGVPPRARPRRAHRPDLQHLRRAHAARATAGSSTRFVVQALRGEPITLHGDGTQTRSFCHVADEIVGLTAVLDGHLTGPINVGNPDEFTIRAAGRAGRRADRLDERDHHRAAARRARGRPAAAPPRHHA